MPIINQVVKNTSSGATKYGVPIDAIIGNVVNGVLQVPGQTSITISGFNDIAYGGLNTRFYGVNLTSFSAPDLTQISGNNALINAFQNATITTLSFDSVEEISATNAMQYMCRYANVTTFSMASLRRVSGDVVFGNIFAQLGLDVRPGPSTVSFPNLEEITGRQVFISAFLNCSNFTTFALPKLTVLSGQLAFRTAFRGSGITTLTLGGTTTIDFGTYTDQFEDMFQGCTQNITVNAPAGNQATIEAMTGYPSFGGTGTVTWNWIS